MPTSDATISTDAIKTAKFRRVVENTFAADSALDAEAFCRGLTPGARFQLASGPAVAGQAAIRGMLADMFKAFRSVTHHLRRCFETDDTLIYEATVTYVFAGGETASVDYCNVLHFDGDLVDDYRVYLDLAPLKH